MDNNENKSKQKKQTWNNWGGGAYKAEPMQERVVTPPEKLTGKKKWQHFWFYYKVHTIVAICILVFAAIMIVDAVTREKYDLTLVLATDNTTISEQETALAEILSQYASDYNGDGKVNIQIDVQNLPISDENANPQVFSAMQTRFAGEMAVGKISLYIMDQMLYDFYELEETMIDLSAEYPDAAGVDGDKFSLVDNVQTQHELLCTDYFKECFIMQRIPEYMAEYDKEKIKAQYANEREFLTNLITGNIVTPLPEASESADISE
ncbi:MAG: hypothetical protein E7487_00265 [Ruminococcaceae bacterium]|nr:hypothetical protein [Oscillospiraceae bacterium]